MLIYRENDPETGKADMNALKKLPRPRAIKS
jgi:hypothetical protein